MAARDRVKRAAPAPLLLAWYRANHRPLPWRGTRDPYRIWVSEIMLQQTRAQAVVPYYERFLARFPTIEALAAAPEAEVLALWAGLGYYSRARNLRRAAQAIAGAFPRDYESIRALPGIGDYTAAAIASIAFQLPYAVLDGNVLRVVARVENDASDIGNARTRERFRAIAQEWLDPADPGHFNQALMELGATVCLPRNPLCLLCPIASRCRAHAEGATAQVPVKLRKVEPVRLEGDAAGDPAGHARAATAAGRVGIAHGRILGAARAGGSAPRQGRRSCWARSATPSPAIAIAWPCAAPRRRRENCPHRFAGARSRSSGRFRSARPRARLWHWWRLLVHKLL